MVAAVVEELSSGSICERRDFTRLWWKEKTPAGAGAKKLSEAGFDD